MTHIPGVSHDDDQDGPGKKERVLHTRVPAVLEKELKRLATNLKVPVSNVVRAILEDAVEAMDAVSERAEGELHGMAERLAHTRSVLKSAPKREAKPNVDAADAPEPAPACPEESGALEGVIGFQMLTLAADAACSVCGRKLARGTRAHRGVRDDDGPGVLLGRECSLLPE